MNMDTHTHKPLYFAIINATKWFIINLIKVQMKAKSYPTEVNRLPREDLLDLQ